MRTPSTAGRRDPYMLITNFQVQYGGGQRGHDIKESIFMCIIFSYLEFYVPTYELGILLYSIKHFCLRKKRVHVCKT